MQASLREFAITAFVIISTGNTAGGYTRSRLTRASAVPIVKGPTIPPRKRKGRAKKLDPFVPYLEMRMQEGVLNCTKLLQEIRKRLKL